MQFEPDTLNKLLEALLDSDSRLKELARLGLPPLTDPFFASSSSSSSFEVENGDEGGLMEGPTSAHHRSSTEETHCEDDEDEDEDDDSGFLVPSTKRSGVQES